MANKKISSLTSLGGTPDVADIIPITDVSDTTGSAQGTTKKVTVTNLMAAAPVQTSDLGTAAALDVGTADTNVVQLSDVSGTVKLPAVDASQLTGIEGTQILSTGESGGVKFLRENGDGTCSFQTADADVDTPLTTALRGTDNPHIGAYPNQSFKVTDNPSKSVMVIADEDGNLDFLVKTDDSNIYLNTPSSRKAASFGFSVVEDSVEPDIEVVGTLAGATENYSVISGDSDSKGANGLPFRQGFNNPDIGANPAPILISGGSIA